ncbi:MULTISPECIES: TylF/MycF/NovP-related O-methyltransferase [Paenibacillus]|uniref:Methyltransferase n=3 Tax=Paenibacillus TaxID=44249 RepID=A0ABX2ZDQ8_PAEPO|nr:MULTISPECIES: TylF/MycF/NovP-related O-methyltransferase [Paenibacillus]ALA44192.1 methyltransferase [Paenibacillus peoriae]APB74006.1 methyltransferase [Paenibacillus polymyxa]APQ61487.1 methyltransferase [Paenibacillus polymyxa]MBP1173362.1 O-methyltransferase [Paenibacillus sp. PvR133]MCP3745906.1 class I SAM-dependent methyltransferase [Paenibacillus sp. A3M_27_13]
MIDKAKVVIFGAGDGGLRVHYLLSDEFEVIAFADNDGSKQGSKFLSKPVVAPNEICKLVFDYVIIANIHGESVYKQLTEELSIEKEKIIDYFMSLKFDTRLALLRQIADEINECGVKGSVAELGVFKGEFSKYINRVFPDRQLYLFDTFSGFDQKDIDNENKGDFSNSVAGEFCNSDVDLVLNKMMYKENCIVKKGYFPESASDVNETFAFVSLDVDLYQPILEGLKFFYPKMSDGGYIIIHDYNSTRFHGVKQAVREYCREHGVKYTPISDLCGSVAIMK